MTDRLVIRNGVASKSPGLGLLGGWMLANMVGGVAGMYLAQVVIGPIEESSRSSVLGLDVYGIQGLIGLILGLTVGLLGWLALKLYFPLSLWWVLATGFGWAIAFLVGRYLFNGLSEALEAQTYLHIGDVTLRLADIMLGSIIGSLIGFFQCAAFKRRLARVEFWILANTAAWTIIWVIMTPVMRFASPLTTTSNETSQAERMLRWSLAGVWLSAILGLVTGATLLWLLRRPAPTASNVGANMDHKR